MMNSRESIRGKLYIKSVLNISAPKSWPKTAYFNLIMFQGIPLQILYFDF